MVFEPPPSFKAILGGEDGEKVKQSGFGLSNSTCKIQLATTYYYYSFLHDNCYRSTYNYYRAEKKCTKPTTHRFCRLFATYDQIATVFLAVLHTIIAHEQIIF